MEMIKKDSATYKERYEDTYLIAKKTLALRKTVTQNDTDSIADKISADILIDTVTRALLHIHMGITRKLLDNIFDFYGQVENLVKDRDVNVSLKRCIVKELERLVVYESWLEGQLKEVKAAYQRKDQQLKSIIDQIDDHKYIINGSQYADTTHARHQGFLKKAMKAKKDVEESMNNLRREIKQTRV